MAQLIIVKSDSSVSNKEIKANFAESIDLPPDSTVALKSLYCTLADDPNNYSFIPPAGTQINYTQNNSPSQVINLISASYTIDSMISDINALLNTQTGYDPDDPIVPPATSPPSEAFNGITHVSQLNTDGQFTLTTYSNGFNNANFNDTDRWILANGDPFPAGVTNTNFVNIPLATVGVTLISASHLSYLGVKMQYTINTADPFTFGVYRDSDGSPEYEIVYQGVGQPYQLDIGGGGPNDIGAPGDVAALGDQVVIKKQRGKVRVEIYRAGALAFFDSDILGTDPYNECIVVIQQAANLSLNIQNVKITFNDSDGSTVNMVTNFTDVLAQYLGLAKSSYTYSGAPAVLDAENNPRVAATTPV